MFCVLNGGGGRGGGGGCARARACVLTQTLKPKSQIHKTDGCFERLGFCQPGLFLTRQRGRNSETGILHRCGHVSLQTPHKEHILASEASMTGRTNLKSLQIAFIKAPQRNSFLFLVLGFCFCFLFRKGLARQGNMGSKLSSLCRAQSQVSYVLHNTKFSIIFSGPKTWELGPWQRVQLEQPSRGLSGAAGCEAARPGAAVLPRTHSDRQFYFFKGKFSLSLLLLKRAIE